MINAKRLLKQQISAGKLVSKLLGLSQTNRICLLDSCGVSHLGSHFLICGIDPLEATEFSSSDAENSLTFLDDKLNDPKSFAIFTLSYDFGLKIEKLKSNPTNFSHLEPDIFLALFDCLIVHDYNSNQTFLLGNEEKFDHFEKLLLSSDDFEFAETAVKTNVSSNFTKAAYLEKVEEIKDYIRCGDTYQTNLTQQFTAELPEQLSPQRIFYNLRKNHPAPFASFIQRQDSTVISASPERFFKIENSKISTSPIKGTRKRGSNPEEDERLKNELLNSEKDRAENVMIVDLLRNDIGRICDFGSVKVEKLCDLEKHPTLFHLVSTVSGRLRENTSFSEIIRAVFPCGSITGAPKIRTMKIIEKLETANRGLSMGAIGFKSAESGKFMLSSFDLSVAIRTMTIKNRRAIFNVGGGIVIDSDPEDEYEETLTKAKALLYAINGEIV